MIKKEQARNLYFQTELSQTRIAELLDVDRKTIYLWIKEGKWAQIKKSAEHTPSILAEQYYSQLLAINKVIAAREEQPYPTREEADIIRKLTLTIKHIKDTPTVCETLDVLMNFANRVFNTDVQLAKALMPIMDKYIKEQVDPPILKPIKPEMEEPEEEEEEEIEETKQETKPQQSAKPQPQPARKTGKDWGINGQLIITGEQAKTLAALQLWQKFTEDFYADDFSDEKGKNKSDNS